MEANVRLLTDVEGEGDGSWQDKSTDQFDEDDELHAEAECTTEISDKDQFHEVVHGRVDPSAALREKNGESIRDGSFADSLRNEDLLTLREGLEHERRQISVFTEQEQVLLVQRVDNVLRVVLDDVRVRKDRYPVARSTLRRLDAIHAEAAG